MKKKNEPDDQSEPEVGLSGKFYPLSLRPRQAGLLESPWPTLFFSLLITWLAWYSAETELNLARNEYFDFRVREAITRIEQRMQAYEQVLLGVKGLYEASVSVERAEFRSYFESLRLSDHYPGIQGVGFSLIVHEADKEKHIASVRKEGFPAYGINPEGAREPYTSIIYLEPFADRNLRAFGYDMYSDPVRRKAMDEACDSGRAAMSGKVRLVQESEGREQSGFLLYLPIYKNGVPHCTVEERRANIIGWAYAPFRMNDLMHGIHGEHAGDLDIEIYDGQEASPPALMYDSEPSAPAVRSGRTALTSLTTIRIAGYPWTIYIRGLKGIYGRIDGKRPLLIAAAGFVISLLLTWLTWVLVKAREQAVKAVQEREKLIAELQKAMAEIKTLQGIIPICSSCKKIREEDGAWRQMEAYIHDHTDAEFSHGLCQECAKRLYGEYLK